MSSSPCVEVFYVDFHVSSVGILNRKRITEITDYGWM